MAQSEDIKEVNNLGGPKWLAKIKERSLTKDARMNSPQQVRDKLAANNVSEQVERALEDSNMNEPDYNLNKNRNYSREDFDWAKKKAVEHLANKDTPEQVALDVEFSYQDDKHSDATVRFKSLLPYVEVMKCLIPAFAAVQGRSHSPVIKTHWDRTVDDLCKVLAEKDGCTHRLRNFVEELRECVRQRVDETVAFHSSHLWTYSLNTSAYHDFDEMLRFVAIRCWTSSFSEIEESIRNASNQ